jgi:outer membrane protein OmpA-like peptidoglycan-associated protein
MKGFAMVKKGSFLLLALLVSLPGCFGRKDKKADSRSKKMAQNGEFSSVNMALADGEMDESMRSFFNDMEEFVSFAEQNGDFELAEADGVRADESSKFDTIYFAFDRYKVDANEADKVKEDARRAQEALAKAKEEDASAVLVVDGHSCNSAGTDAYNLALSEKRAKEVADQLVANGVDRSDLKVVGRGTEMMVVQGNREEQWANRRVELHVVHG